MPLPDFLISANAFICQEALTETNGIVTAVRLVDLFQVPQKPANFPADFLPMIQPQAIITLRAQPGHTGTHSFRVRLLNTVGESKPIMEHTAAFQIRPGCERLGPTVNLVVQLQIGVSRYGLCSVCADVDGVEVARAPFMLLPSTDTPAAS
jgi:hypothetical protein